MVTAQADLAEAEKMEVRLRYQGYQAAAKLAYPRGDADSFAR